MRHLLVLVALASTVLAACSPAGTPGEATATPTTPAPTDPPPTDLPQPDDQRPAVQAALEALAASLGIALDQIKVVSVEAVEWPDGCLGVYRPEVMCTEAIVPGYRIELEANGTAYLYHTNEDGSALTPAGQPASEVPAGLIEAARQALAKALGISVEAITVFNAVPVEWPDACLGLALPGVVCAEVITPGYLVELEAQGEVYGYHANQDGSVLRPGSLVLTWQRDGGIAGFCDSLAVFRSGEIEGRDCKRPEGRTLDGLLTPEERTALEALLAVYETVAVEDAMDPNVSDAMALRLVLYGLGDAQPGPDEQAAMLAWAQDLYNRVSQ